MQATVYWCLMDKYQVLKMEVQEEQVTTMSFLGYLIEAKPPRKLGKMLRMALHHSIILLKLEVHFVKVTRVITLAPHEVHLYH